MLAHSDGFSELGRYAITFRSIDIGAFKTPTLRDVELTSPYMHNGSLPTLLDVVRLYNRGGNANSYLDERMQPLRLTDREVNDLVEFMRSLTSCGCAEGVPDFNSTKVCTGVAKIEAAVKLRSRSGLIWDGAV